MLTCFINSDILAIIKAQSMRFFAFSLLAIIVSFSGMCTSFLYFIQLHSNTALKQLAAQTRQFSWAPGSHLRTSNLT